MPNFVIHKIKNKYLLLPEDAQIEPHELQSLGLNDLKKLQEVLFFGTEEDKKNTQILQKISSDSKEHEDFDIYNNLKDIDINRSFSMRQLSVKITLDINFKRIEDFLKKWILGALANQA